MSISEDEFIIGEGVVLDAAAATVGLRFLAGLLDIVILGVVYWFTLVAFGIGGLFSVDFALFSALLLAHFVAVFVGIPVTIETLTRGRSVGKLAAGIRIVRDDGGPIGFRQAFVRALVGLIESWLTFGSVAFLTSLVSKRSKRVGDMFAGTYALRVRGPRHVAAALYIPPALQAWSTTADIRRLPDGLALQARQFLSRAATLSPASRAHFGTLFQSKVAPYVAPPPPVETHPETFLMAVLATRRDREYAIAVEHMRADAEQSKGVQRLPFGVPDVSD